MENILNLKKEKKEKEREEKVIGYGFEFWVFTLLIVSFN